MKYFGLNWSWIKWLWNSAQGKHRSCM